MNHLFCYGTLCDVNVMQSVIGRIPLLEAARLDGYARYAILGENYSAVAPEGSSCTFEECIIMVFEYYKSIKKRSFLGR